MEEDLDLVPNLGKLETFAHRIPATRWGGGSSKAQERMER